MIPTFFSDEQWLEWMVRPENMFGQNVNDTEAQKRFLTEWYFDRLAQDRELAISPQACCVLQEIRTYRPGLRLPRYLQHIYTNRPDLRKAFPATNPATPKNLLTWFMDYGFGEYPYRSILQLATQVFTTAEFTSFESSTASLASALPPSSRKSIAEKAFGVNLVGYAQGEFGLGEDIRTLAKCLEAVNIEYCVFNIPEGSSSRLEDHTLDHKFEDKPPYPITILCVSPFDIHRLRQKYAQQIFNDRYVIAYSPWELEKFPPEWAPALSIPAEIWAISKFVLNTYQESTVTPCYHMPPAVDVGLDRNPKRLGGGSIFRFVCSYDPNSFISRKNPQATVDAFLLAFEPVEEKVELALLVNGEFSNEPEDVLLRESCAKDPRITLISGTHTRKIYHNLISSAQCYVSPHRAEGFGRNIAEAKALGVPVLVTGYSGSNDFTSSDERVSWSYISVGRNGYPFSENFRWADINVQHLAERMRHQFQNQIYSRRPSLSALYSVKLAGERYKERLKKITEID